MASTDLVTPSKRLIYIGDVESNRPNSESINQKLSGSVNYVIERLFHDENFTLGGYFNPNAFDNGSAGIRYIEKDCVISMYQLALYKTGSAGTSSFNIAVYNSAGGFINNLFGTGGNAISMTGANGTNVLVGKRDVDTITPNNININTAGHTVFNGNLNVGTNAVPLLAGYFLVPFVISNATSAYNMNFQLRLKDL